MADERKASASQAKNRNLLIAAVILVAAFLVGIAVFGPLGESSDARMAQSDSYWKGEARPFAILEHTMTSGGNGELVLENMDSTGTYTINKIKMSINDIVVSGEMSTSIGAGAPVAPGATQKISISHFPSNAKSGDMYSYNVVINYTSPSGMVSQQIGAKPIVGRYE